MSMKNKELFYALLEAENDQTITRSLEDHGYSTDEYWQPLGGIENNFSVVGNQQEEPTGALVEKLVNSIDAVLMSECFQQGLNPESSEAPKSMVDAVEKFFDIPDGRLDSLDPKQRTALAEKLALRLIAVGSKEAPSYLVVDAGEGQTPSKFPDTFLSISKSNKLRIPFVQGKFNAGGTGVLQFCGVGNYQLIVSKRHPKARVDPGDITANMWGFTLVRRLLPAEGRKSSMYVYFAPDEQILTFKDDSINVLPDSDTMPNKPPKPYAQGLEFGTCVKLYNYSWRAKSVATTAARYELEQYFHAPCLPLRVTETRGYAANSYSTTIAGVLAVSSTPDVEDHKIEKGFPASGSIDIEGVGTLPYRILVFTEDMKTRRIPSGVFFTVNGQRHGSLPANFIKGQLKFDYISKYLFVSVDCTAMEENVREDFFMTSRDRVRKNEAFNKVKLHLQKELKNHPGLRLLNAERREKKIKKTLDDRNTIEIFNRLLRSDPSLAGLFSSGQQLTTRIGPGESPAFEGKEFPTYFRLSKEPKAGLVKHCPINKSIRVKFETDAVNDYFNRSNSPGSIQFCPSGLKLDWKLWNGKLLATFSPMKDTTIGDSTKISVVVSDVVNDRRNGPFEAKFTMVVDAPLERPNVPGPSDYDKHIQPQGKLRKPLKTLPEIKKVYKSEWSEYDPPFDELEAVRVRSSGDGEDSYDFYINMDNAFLLTELSRAGNKANKEMMAYWFEYGLVLCGMGILNQAQSKDDTDSTDGQTDTQVDADPLELCNRALAGLARVIIPIVHRLPKLPKNSG